MRLDRKRLALVLAIPTMIVVLAIGLTRGQETGDADPPTSTTLPATVGAAAAAAAVLQPASDVIDVPEGSACDALTEDDAPVCQSFQVLDLEVAWLVEREPDASPVASFLRRTSPTSWTRVLTADGGVVPFDSVNARLEDLTGDGRVETVFGFHLGNRLRLDVVDANGEVVFHFDAPLAQATIEDGALTVWMPEGADWRRQELRLAGGDLEVVSSELVDGPAQGNI